MYCQIFRQIVCRAIKQTLCSVAVSKETLHKACAEDASSDFSADCIEIPQADLVSGKGFLGNMTENLQADCVQSRQAGFMQCCRF